MQLTINLEAPDLISTFDVLADVQELLFTPDVKVRVQYTSYWHEKGPRSVRTIIVLVPDVPAARGESLRDRLSRLADMYNQDCVAYKIRDYGCTVRDLAGPRADRWFPFNNDFFVEY